MLSKLIMALAAMPLAGCAFNGADRGTVDSFPLVSLCEVAGAPRSWQGRTARVRAVYVTDLMHYVYLEDPSCRGKIFEWIDGDRADRQSLDDFERAVLSDHSQIGGSYDVELVGRFGRAVTDRFKGALHVRKVIHHRRTSASQKD